MGQRLAPIRSLFLLHLNGVVGRGQSILPLNWRTVLGRSRITSCRRNDAFVTIAGQKGPPSLHGQVFSPQCIQL
jgi:hypothetical protein